MLQAVLLAINVLTFVFMAVARFSQWGSINAMMYHIPEPFVGRRNGLFSTAPWSE